MLIPLPEIDLKEWLLKHAGHSKFQDTGVMEEEFIPDGARIATKYRKTILLCVFCHDCKEIVIYDTIKEEADI